MAISVVLLLPEDIMDRAITINRWFSCDPIRLDKQDCLPHISLCMGTLESHCLPDVIWIVDRIVQRFRPLHLTIDKTDTRRSCFYIKEDDELQRLHEEIMLALSPYLSYDATVDMCLSPPIVVEKTASWINGYRRNRSFENFFPHITLGVSQILPDEVLDIDFVSSRLAISHLGNYCTCRKILHLVDIVPHDVTIS